MLTTEQLIDLQKKIDEAKNKKARSEGVLSSLIEQLKKEFGVDNIEDAEKEHEKMIKKREALDSMMEKENKRLEDKLCSANIKI